MIEFFKNPTSTGWVKRSISTPSADLSSRWTSIFLNHGLRYGIDFKGGPTSTCAFATSQH